VGLQAARHRGERSLAPRQRSGMTRTSPDDVRASGAAATGIRRSPSEGGDPPFGPTTAPDEERVVVLMNA
jgi:hypothetical protein